MRRRVSRGTAVCLACLAVTLVVLGRCGPRASLPTFLLPTAPTAEDARRERQQFLLVATHRHMLKPAMHGLHARGLREHAATVPIDLRRGIQAGADATWGKIQKLRPEEWSVLCSRSRTKVLQVHNKNNV